LLATGILSRHLVLGPSLQSEPSIGVVFVTPPHIRQDAGPADNLKPRSPTLRDDGIDSVNLRTASPVEADLRSLLLSGVLALAVFPAAMRRLNRLQPQPGLEHVALPFSLGFFLDLAQVTVLRWIPELFK
jgi:hypothetical protein